MPSTNHRSSSLVAASHRRSLQKPTAQLHRRFLNRYRALPPWLLLAQAFLAFGWLRAGVAHGVNPRWWDGSEVDQFTIDVQPHSIDWYGATMLDGPVSNWPAAIAVLVLVMQVFVAVLLVANVRPLLALLLGAGLNVNFILAGAVNPSVFYLIIGAALALWHVENSMSLVGHRRLSSASTLIGAVALGALVPEIRTVDPAMVIDDPAVVLSFATLLWVGAVQINVRTKLRLIRPMPNGPDGQTYVGHVPRPVGGPPTIPGMAFRRCDRPGRSMPRF